MCCGLSPRALLILVSCYAIIQSVIYLVFSIIGILITDCSFSMEGTQFNYLLYLAYFRDGSCGPIDWTILGITETVPMEPTVTDVVGRTYTFLVAYLVLSSVWIVSSMSLIVSTFTPCMSLLCLKLFSFPWLVTCFAIVALDITATVFHVIDITNTTSIGDFLIFIGFTDPSPILESAQAIPSYLTTLPSVTMMIVSLRGFLLFAINISCLIYVIRGVRKMLKNELMKKNKPVRPDFGYEREFTNNHNHNNNRAETVTPNSIEETPAQITEISRYNDASLANQYQYDNNGFNPEPMQQLQVPPNQRYLASGNNYVFVSEKRFMEPLKGGIAPRSDDGMSSRLSNPRSLDSVDDISRASSNMGARSQLSDRTIDYEQELMGTTPVESRLSYLSGDSMLTDNGDRRRNQEPPPILVKPSLIKQHVQQQQQQNQMPQYMRQHQQIREEDVVAARSSYQTPPDELRSQLPWSYFQDRDEITRPPRQRSDDELGPPVPVPDYTLHFPKRKERPPTMPKPTRPVQGAATVARNEDNADNNNERWSGPEYTY